MSLPLTIESVSYDVLVERAPAAGHRPRAGLIDISIRECNGQEGEMGMAGGRPGGGHGAGSALTGRQSGF
jgi:hypothetical protein